MSSSQSTSSYSAALKQRLLRAREQRQSPSTSRSLFVGSPFGSGGFGRDAIPSSSVTQEGEELIWVRDPDRLCLGRIGGGGKACLKDRHECGIESHALNKCSLFPSEPFLTLKKGAEKGYEPVVLETTTLDDEFVMDLLNQKDVNWVEEFAQIRASNAVTRSDMDRTKALLMTARKHTTFATPAKQNALDQLSAFLTDLTDLDHVVTGLAAVSFNENGEKIEPNFEFTEEGVKEAIRGLRELGEFLADHASVVFRILSNQPSTMEGYVKPLEAVVSGLRLELESVKGCIGQKDESKVDVPPVLWKAVETGFSTLHGLEADVGSIKTSVDAMSITVEDLKEFAELMMKEFTESSFDNHQPLGKGATKQSETADTSPLEFGGPSLVDGFLRRPGRNASTQPSWNGGRKAGGTSGAKHRDSSQSSYCNDGGNSDPGYFGGGAGCDQNSSKCNKCMTRMDDLEAALLSNTARVSNLEQAKSGKIESALLMKNQIFRSRDDVAAWTERHFPTSLGKTIEGACFPSLHYIFNIVTADMCGKSSPKITLEDKDLTRLGVRKPDASAFFAIQADKPDFMLSSTTCPSYSYKATKAEKDKAMIRFIPSFEDFGNNSDSGSLHHRFKTSLKHTKSKQKKYIESRLDNHPHREVKEISLQCLEDSCDMVFMILDFMVDLYTACNESFDATSEAWELACHCLNELFVKELKPCLSHSVTSDLVEAREAMVDVIHTGFALNSKLRELLAVGLKNHPSTTTSHVRFVMKMSKASKKAEDKTSGLQNKYNTLSAAHDDLKKELDDTKSLVKRLESRLDSHISTYKKDKKSMEGKGGSKDGAGDNKRQ